MSLSVRLISFDLHKLQTRAKCTKHSQQDLKNRVYQRKVKLFKWCHSQETRFLTLVQDVRTSVLPDSKLL
jgi:hypothetical protein